MFDSLKRKRGAALWNELWQGFLICLFVLVLPGGAVIHCWLSHYTFWKGVTFLLSCAFEHILVAVFIVVLIFLLHMFAFILFLINIDIDIDIDKVAEKVDRPFGGEPEYKQGIITMGAVFWGWIFYLLAIFPYAVGYVLLRIYLTF